VTRPERVVVKDPPPAPDYPRYRVEPGERLRLVIVLQAMDTGGKDGTIKGVLQGVNPQGCQVWSFKAPAQRA
jgi:polyphosphate kinase 2 (PPK2 family)